jgi:hypothetical protein
VLARIGGRAVVRGRVENHAVEGVNGGVHLVRALSVSRGGKNGKGEAQDCKAFHRGSPNLTGACIQEFSSEACAAACAAELRKTQAFYENAGFATSLVLFRGVD